MATKVTSASPIIRAAAVDAVRVGFLIAFSRAIRPMLPPKRLDGQPIARASGRTSLDERSATPTNSARMPNPSEASRGAVATPWTKSP